jgi:lipopolysaccharide/colanic/teichoic acid biosynthesis glycosyltransferase
MTPHDLRRAAPSRPAGRRADAACSLPSQARRRLSKHLLDVSVAAVLLLLAAPLLVAAAVAVRATTPGPALFRQTRLGQGWRPFTLYKFRTMYTGCSDAVHREYVRSLLTEEAPPAGSRSGLYKLDADARITPVGRLLRRTSIDELPQLINVLRGDMSLVGPRPALPWEADLLGDTDYARFLVPPGLTGLWQVSGRNCLTMREGLRLDREYVSRQSLALDLVILLRTVPVVLSTRGAR